MKNTLLHWIGIPYLPTYQRECTRRVPPACCIVFATGIIMYVCE
jgi:hypothetical protein